jgi:hypothetical protein
MCKVSNNANPIIIIIIIIDRLCGLVVRVSGYRSGGPDVIKYVLNY